MMFGRKEALEYLAELDKTQKQMKRVSAIWTIQYAMENLSQPVIGALLELANSLKTLSQQMPVDYEAHKEKQPYYRRHAKGWNK